MVTHQTTPPDLLMPPVSLDLDVTEGNEEVRVSSKPFPSFGRTWLYFVRAFYLCCPLCGASPIFPPFYQFNSVAHWFVTLPSCSHCNIKYYREPGYFQIVIWFLSIEGMIVFGIIGFILVDQIIHLSFWKLLLFNAFLVFVVNILTIRHAKAFFIALDLLIDPYSD